MFIRHRLVWLFIVFAFVISLTGCNMPSDDADAPEPVQEELNPDSEPGQEELNPNPEPGQDDANPIIEPTDWPTMQPNPDHDPCLEGNWVMPTDRLNLFMATLFPQTSSFMRVTEGSLRMSFQDGLVNYDGDYVMHVDSGPDTYAEAYIEFFNGGAYATEDNDRLTFDLHVTQAHTLSCTAYKGGERFTTPCAGFGVEDLVPPSTGPYLCADHELQIDILSPAGEPVTMFFER